MDLRDIKSMTLPELERDFFEFKLKKYCAKQVYEWLVKGVSSFDNMTNISLSLRNFLKTIYYINNLNTKMRVVSKLDDTVKYLFQLNDGAFIESVLMKYNHGYTVCISTQVGCKMGCSFCATGKDKFFRNLYASEMLAQVQKIQNENNVRISNIVLMGMGEPLDNYDNVLKFLRIVSGFYGIGMRHISLSTCGVVDKIYRLAEEKLQLTLSVSLHAANDTLRNNLMPINKKWNIDELIKSCRYYFDVTGRRISFEYALINGVNDKEDDARSLVKLLRGFPCHVNLIPVNNVKETNFKKSSSRGIKDFCNLLTKNGLNATVRRTLGADIEASCGQLRQRVVMCGGG